MNRDGLRELRSHMDLLAVEVEDLREAAEATGAEAVRRFVSGAPSVTELALAVVERAQIIRALLILDILDS